MKLQIIQHRSSLDSLRSSIGLARSLEHPGMAMLIAHVRVPRGGRESSKGCGKLEGLQVRLGDQWQTTTIEEPEIGDERVIHPSRWRYQLRRHHEDCVTWLSPMTTEDELLKRYPGLDFKGQQAPLERWEPWLRSALNEASERVSRNHGRQQRMIDHEQETLDHLQRQRERQSTEQALKARRPRHNNPQ